jgi:ligand-binding SRPBCC domain-containing protein
MIYRHRFRVRAPLARVAEFHSRAASLAALTPPPIIVRLHRAPAIQRQGDEVDFTMWLGPLPIRWTARIDSVSDTAFVDRQVRGPFRFWRHRHAYAPIDAGATEVTDEVEAELKRHWLWSVVGGLMWLGLPLLFAYRGWKTRRVLEGRPAWAES